MFTTVAHQTQNLHAMRNRSNVNTKKNRKMYHEVDNAEHNENKNIQSEMLYMEQPFINDAQFSFVNKFLDHQISYKTENSTNLLGQGKKMGEITSMLFKEKIKRSQNKNYNYTKTKKAEFLYYQYLYNTFMQCLFALSSIISGIMAYEIEYNYPDTFKIELSVSLWFCFISSICMWGTILYEFYFDCQIMAINKNVPEKVWRRETNTVVSLILTLSVFFMHPNPAFRNVKVEIFNDKYMVLYEHSLNSILTVFCLLRMWYFVKFYLVYSEYYSPRTQRVCQMNNFDTSLYFSMKASMIKTPYHVYLLLFLILLLYCSFCLRIFERVLDYHSDMNFSSYWNSIWCLVCTMTTVGYGDYYPSSTLGRTIGIISCICGVFLISMLIVTITNVLNFQGTEENVFLILQRLKLTKQKDDLAANLISKYMKLMKNVKNSRNKEEAMAEREKAREDILLGLYYLKEKNLEIDSTFPAYSNFDIVSDNLAMLDGSMSNLRRKYDILQKHIDNIAKKF
jgi:hypothetical protein